MRRQTDAAVEHGTGLDEAVLQLALGADVHNAKRRIELDRVLAQAEQHRPVTLTDAFHGCAGLKFLDADQLTPQRQRAHERGCFQRGLGGRLRRVRRRHLGRAGGLIGEVDGTCLAESTVHVERRRAVRAEGRDLVLREFPAALEGAGDDRLAAHGRRSARVRRGKRIAEDLAATFTLGIQRLLRDARLVCGTPRGLHVGDRLLTPLGRGAVADPAVDAGEALEPNLTVEEAIQVGRQRRAIGRHQHRHFHRFTGVRVRGVFTAQRRQLAPWRSGIRRPPGRGTGEERHHRREARGNASNEWSTGGAVSRRRQTLNQKHGDLPVCEGVRFGAEVPSSRASGRDHTSKFYGVNQRGIQTHTHGALVSNGFSLGRASDIANTPFSFEVFGLRANRRS